MLDKCERLAVANGLNIETVIAEDDATSKIADYAKKERFGLIVIGSRCLGRFEEMVVGSVSNRVLHHAKCSYSS